MPHPIFLSHDHRDRPIADAIKTLLWELSLEQLIVWYTSDSSPTGGVQLGGDWQREIPERLEKSHTILSLLTPHSIAKPWVLFEAGYGAALPERKLIPLTLGITQDLIPGPLQPYQSARLADYQSLREFCSRLLARHGFPLKDTNDNREHLNQAIDVFSRHVWTEPAAAQASHPGLVEARDEIKKHIDLKLHNFFLNQAVLDPATDRLPRSGFVPYDVRVTLKFDEAEKTEILQIKEDTNVDQVTDNVYYLIRGKVKAYTYLKDWILRHTESRRLLVIKEFGRKIAASQIFLPGEDWEAAPLEQPYTWEDSKDYERWA